MANDFQTTFVWGQRHASQDHRRHEWGPTTFVQRDIFITQPSGPNEQVGSFGYKSPQTLLTDFAPVRKAGW